MACIRKTPSGHRVDWRDKQGHRYRETFELKKNAEDHLADVRVKQKAGSCVGPKLVPTFREVTQQWFANKQGIEVATVVETALSVRQKKATASWWGLRALLHPVSS